MEGQATSAFSSSNVFFKDCYGGVSEFELRTKARLAWSCSCSGVDSQALEQAEVSDCFL